MPDTVGYNSVKIFDTPGCRNTSRDYSRQYENPDGTRSGMCTSRINPNGLPARETYCVYDK
ncbi:hypothetical protein GCM10008995_06860 [Halobellus salinus]|uniref:Uncharacterized protein n=1 Tax=Halobellus salinus TaxID=931585 RepID=A0A830E875_9EURY|nr:hypothetical protein GCM10008995_06860 [Halobellus salinus]